MEYYSITYEEALNIVEGTNSGGGNRQTFVVDSSCSGSNFVYVEGGSLCVSAWDCEETLLSARKVKSSAWYIGVLDDGDCVLEARNKKGDVAWRGTVLVRPETPACVLSLLVEDCNSSNLGQ